MNHALVYILTAVALVCAGMALKAECVGTRAEALFWYVNAALFTMGMLSLGLAP